MGFFDKFRRAQAPPADLREALLDAADRRDAKRFFKLCRTHADEIRKSFPQWKNVPEELRKNQKALNRYADGLIAIASAFQQNGDSSLIQQLAGDDADNPVFAWQRDLTEANRLLDNGETSAAIALLQSILQKMQGTSGTAVDEIMPKVLGALGAAYFKAGDNPKAIEFTQKALEHCAKVGDTEGAEIYRGNLRHISSADQGEQLIFRDEKGRVLSEEDLKNHTGGVTWEFTGKPVPENAKRLHEQGRALGKKGDVGKAAELFEEASRLAPDWPYPVYDLAYTRLLQKRFDEALACYERVDKLDPAGFFTAKTAIWTLKREQAGKYKPGTYLAYLAIEENPSKAESLARELVEAYPDFAPAWKELALATKSNEKTLTFLERGLAADPDAETYGMLQINKATTLMHMEKPSEAALILNALLLDPKSTRATTAMTKILVARLS